MVIDGKDEYFWLKDYDGTIELRYTKDKTRVTFPYVSYEEITDILREKLKKKDLEIKLCEKDGNIMGRVEPANYKLIGVLAPLKCRTIFGIAVLKDMYLAQNAYPKECQSVTEELLQCKREVAEEQFEKLFEENSLDGGITAVIRIDHTGYATEGFDAKYIPEGYLEICSDNFSVPGGLVLDVLYIKKQNVNGEKRTIKVPDELKGLAIGKEGKNIKRIAREINASKIYVE
jgi:hypothetical protein